MNEDTLLPLPGSPGCVICDNNGSNPRSLKLRLLWDAQAKRVCIPCEPDESWCGYSRIVHGGIVASVLDEAMAWAVKQSTGDWAFTAECRLRFKRPLEPGRRYTAVAEVVSMERRKIVALADFLEADGSVAAHAEAVFLPSKGRARPRQEEDGQPDPAC